MLVYYLYFAFQETTVDNNNLYGQKLPGILQRNFYVADIVKSLYTVDEATEVIHKVRYAQNKASIFSNSLVTRMKN